MKHNDLSDTTAQLPQGTVLIIGNFDAVHLGHLYLIEQARATADLKETDLSVLTFAPHPRRLFRPEDKPFRITPDAQKIKALEATGKINHLFTLPFNWEIANLSAEDFVEHIIKRINPTVIYIGEDFRFGHNRTGCAQTLKDAGFETKSVTLKTDPQHGVISATRIRGLIQSGHMDEVKSLLGREWIIEGKVTKGDQRGRELGYPTANVPLEETIHSAYGVYATYVRIEGETKWRMAATNIGIRPMFEVETALIEAHILDFSGDLYGKTLEIKPVAKIRNEEKFTSLEALIKQIEKDCAKCRDILELKPAA